MRVRLKTRWGSRLQGDIVSVSAERAKALVQAGIAVHLKAGKALSTEDKKGKVEDPPAGEDKKGKKG